MNKSPRINEPAGVSTCRFFFAGNGFIIRDKIPLGTGVWKKGVTNMKNIRISDDLRVRLDAVTRVITKCRRELAAYPDGRLRIKRQKDSVYYYHVTDNRDKNGVLLRGDDPLVRLLAQKEYLQTLLKLAETEQSVIAKALDKYPSPLFEGLYETYSPQRQRLISPIILPDEEFARRWMEKPYRYKPISDNIPVYLTMKNERVRSKSEQIIADHLNTKGIPYKYECPIYIGDMVFHPDFTILRMSDREEIYYEHLGRMDDPKYAADNVRKLSIYALNGLTLGDKLFTTFETSMQPLDVRILDDLIEKKFR